MSDDFVIFSGSANPGLAEPIARELGSTSAPIIAASLERLLSGGWSKHEPTII